jgi:predicted  nucleic acid-binding Zn-ribbon protein
MHDDAEKIWKLWGAEQARDKLLAEWRGLHADVDRLAKEHADSVERAVQAQAASDALRDEERSLNRRLETYQKRRDKAQKMIDEGTAPDFRAAQAQAEQCGSIVDDLETELLELMERMDQAATALKGAIDGRDHLAHRCEAARTRYQERLKVLKPEFEAATGARDLRRERVYKEHLGLYDRLRDKKMSVFGLVDSETCTACHVKLNGTLVSDLKRGAEVLTCPSCGRYLAMREA